jgi:hypothetical protein
VERLTPEWGNRVGSPAEMRLPVSVTNTMDLGPTLRISILSPQPEYGAAYLTALLDEHRAAWRSMVAEATATSAKLLEDELARLKEKVRMAEDDLIEYERLYDVIRVDARADMERTYLSALFERKRQIEDELRQMEIEHPALASEEEDTPAGTETNSSDGISVEFRERYKALKLQHDAVEKAEYKWQAKDLVAQQRRSEWRRLKAILDRYERDCDALDSRLHDLRSAEALRAEQVRLLEPVRVRPQPSRPARVLLIALALGVACGVVVLSLSKTRVAD